MKASDYIVSFLEEKGIDTVFGYIGGMITHLTDSLDKNPHVRFVQVYHEQTAAIAAEGYAKIKGIPGVAISTSGPGATNMMTGIADAYFDSAPVIYMTGQVNTYEYKYDKPVRQQGFQETDIVAMVRPVTKYAVMVDDISNLRYELEKAYAIAMEGRRGPVLLDIPMDIQRKEIEPSSMKGFEGLPLCCKEEISGALDRVARLLEKAQAPLILAGAGVKSSVRTQQLLESVSEKLGIPVVVSLLGKGAYGEDSPLFMGMLGSYGNRCANMAVANADFLLVLGSRLDTRQTGARVDSFLKDGIIVHVDIDEHELDCHRLQNRLSIHSDAESFLSALCDASLQVHTGSWRNYLKEIKSKYDQKNEIERFAENKSPYRFFQSLNPYIGVSDILCSDIGQNQMWAAQTLELPKGAHFLTSGGLAPMGFSIPVAVGACFASNSNVWAFTGDGGFHISTQALMLISQYDLPVKVFVLNNESLGMITQFQELYFEKRFAGTVPQKGYCIPDIEKLAQAYGLPYFRLDMTALKDEVLLAKIASTRNCIVEYRIEGLTKVYPKLEYDKPIGNPSPHLSEGEISDHMFKRK